MGRFDKFSSLTARQAVALPPEDFEIGLESCDRRPELVTGIGHEPLLLVPRGRQSAEHRGESSGQPTDLAGSRRIQLSPGIQLFSEGYLFSRLGGGPQPAAPPGRQGPSR